MAAIMNYDETLKKSHAHLHIVGNVIVKFEQSTTSKKLKFIRGGHFEFQ